MSDWSSDVCSSDLRASGEPRVPRRRSGFADMAPSFSACGIERKPPTGGRSGGRSGKHSQSDPESVRSGAMTRPADALTLPSELVVLGIETRSEEHTSELQSLMRISYAVFCLKKKKKKTDY